MERRDLAGTVLAGCRIDALIGRGSMGEVWKGTHLGLKRPVAVKVLAMGPRDAETEAALLREARALASVEHPNVVKVYDVRLEAEAVCMVLELLEGRTLLAKVRDEGPFVEEELYETAFGAARGLGAIHAAGLVHRDLKLDNVLATAAGAVKITDFGLAVARGGDDRYKGAIVGTPAYISPEQWLGRPIDGRADLYALGALLYACASGDLPFKGAGAAEYREAHLKIPAVDPRKRVPGLNAGLAAVILKLLRKDRQKRYASVAEFLEDLERCRRGERPAAAVAKTVKCGFCGEPVVPVKGRCPHCREPVGNTGAVELGLRPNEFNCPACRAIVARGARACPGCARGLCRNCLTTLAGPSGYCAPCEEAAAPPSR